MSVKESEYKAVVLVERMCGSDIEGKVVGSK